MNLVIQRALNIVVELVFVFLAAALGVAEVDHVIVFAVF